MPVVKFEKNDKEKFLELFDNVDIAFESCECNNGDRLFAIEGHNGKHHGQKGHRKSYLMFKFDVTGALTELKTYTPSGKNKSFDFT